MYVFFSTCKSYDSNRIRIPLRQNYALKLFYLTSTIIIYGILCQSSVSKFDKVYTQEQ